MGIDRFFAGEYGMRNMFSNFKKVCSTGDTYVTNHFLFMYYLNGNI